jgi:hypothetical protein
MVGQTALLKRAEVEVWFQGMPMLKKTGTTRCKTGGQTSPWVDVEDIGEMLAVKAGYKIVRQLLL